MRLHRCLATLATCCTLFACREGSDLAPPQNADAPNGDSGFTSQLLAAAADYRNYALVNQHAQLAPALCRYIPPTPMTPVTPRLSQSDSDSTHGRKLYFLYAKDLSAYVAAVRSGAFTRAGQVLVKESWTLVDVGPLSARSAVDAPSGQNSAPLPRSDTLIREGRYYRTGEPAGLFIMLKLAPGTPDTDNGWVYGTVSPDGKTVTSAGRVESCMKCHVDAPHDRLFGPNVHKPH